MVKAITKGVEVAVSSKYEVEFSNPSNLRYVFSYKVNIKNNNVYPIQLISRKWYVLDSLSNLDIIKGEGVIGEQPIIMPTKSHSYISGCHLKSDIGRMHGFYSMINKATGERFKVKIPAFTMVSKMRLN